MQLLGFWLARKRRCLGGAEQVSALTYYWYNIELIWRSLSFILVRLVCSQQFWPLLEHCGGKAWKLLTREMPWIMMNRTCKERTWGFCGDLIRFYSALPKVLVLGCWAAHYKACGWVLPPPPPQGLLIQCLILGVNGRPSFTGKNKRVYSRHC